MTPAHSIIILLPTDVAALIRDSQEARLARAEEAARVVCGGLSDD